MVKNKLATIMGRRGLMRKLIIGAIIMTGAVLAYLNHRKVDILARTIWGEARGDGELGMRAVANVINNRANIGGWWGGSIVAVALMDKQFSAWNENDPNRAKMLSVTADDKQFALALIIAKDVVRGVSVDPTGGATHYHTTAVSPDWRDDSKITKQIGTHIFYKGIK